MTLTNEQRDWIVDEVVRRVLAALKDGATPTAGEARLELEERLVTLETLRGRLDGVSSLVVGARAVVTPAVADLLNERGVVLERRSPTP